MEQPDFYEGMARRLLNAFRYHPDPEIRAVAELCEPPQEEVRKLAEMLRKGAPGA